MLAMIRSSTTK